MVAGYFDGGAMNFIFYFLFLFLGFEHELGG